MNICYTSLAAFREVMGWGSESVMKLLMIIEMRAGSV